MSVTMVTTTPIPATQTETEPMFWCFVFSKGCCRGMKLKPNEAFVPEGQWLYRKVRDTDPDRNKPLTEEEMRPFVRCRVHTLGPTGKAYNKEHAIKMMSRLEDMLALMAHWKNQTPEAREKRRQEKREKRRLERANRGPAPAVTRTKVYGEMRPVAKQSSKKDSENHKKGGKGKGQ